MIKVIKKCLNFQKRFYYSLSFICNKNYSESRKYYNILRINENSSKEEIKEAYFKLVKLHHPDLKSHSKNYCSNPQDREEIPFYEIQNAYEQLISQIEQKENKIKTNDKKERKIDEIIDVIIKAGMNSNTKNKDDCKQLQPDTIFYPLFGVKLFKEDILYLKQIIKKVNYKIYKRKLKSEEIRKQNEKLNMNANNVNINLIKIHNEKINSKSIDIIDEEDSSKKIPLSSVIFLKITKIIAITGISIFFVVNFGIYIGGAISIYVIFLSLI